MEVRKQQWNYLNLYVMCFRLFIMAYIKKNNENLERYILSHKFNQLFTLMFKFTYVAQHIIERLYISCFWMETSFQRRHFNMNWFYIIHEGVFILYSKRLTIQAKSVRLIDPWHYFEGILGNCAHLCKLLEEIAQYFRFQWGNIVPRYNQFKWIVLADVFIKSKA